MTDFNTKAAIAFETWMEDHGERLCSDYDVDSYGLWDMLGSAFKTGYSAGFEGSKIGQADAWALWLNNNKGDIEDAFRDYAAGYDLMKLTLADGFGWEDK